MLGAPAPAKRLMAIACRPYNRQLDLRENIYTRLIVSRPVQPMGKDIGFLPGTMEEKDDAMANAYPR